VSKITKFLNYNAACLTKTAFGWSARSVSWFIIAKNDHFSTFRLHYEDYVRHLISPAGGKMKI
jgi:hypothetical protein